MEWKTDIYNNLELPENVIVRYSIGLKGKHTSLVSTDPNKCNCKCNIDKDKLNRSLIYGLFDEITNTLSINDIRLLIILLKGEID